jgi:hypothetical protein
MRSPRAAKNFFSASVSLAISVLYGLRTELTTVYLCRGIISANSHMNGQQERADPYPPVPMPRNAQEAHTLLGILIVTWVLGLILLLWMDRKRK